MKVIKKSLNYIIATIPIIYFLILVKNMPQQVTIHYTVNGVSDKLGSKYVYLVLCFIPLLMAILSTYLKKYVLKENEKYFSISMTVIIVFFSIITMYILTIANMDTYFSMDLIIILFSFLFIFFGNIFNKIKRNLYFGIRFPATLKNDKVWHEVHKIGGYCFTSLGIILLVLMVIQIKSEYIVIVMIVLLLAMILLLWIYSEVLIKKIEKNKNNFN